MGIMGSRNTRCYCLSVQSVAWLYSVEQVCTRYYRPVRATANIFVVLSVHCTILVYFCCKQTKRSSLSQMINILTKEKKKGKKLLYGERTALLFLITILKIVSPFCV